MVKVIFDFAGTAQEADDVAKEGTFGLANSKDPIRIYIPGCQHPCVGGSVITPNLDIGANNIHAAFKNGSLDIAKLKELFGQDIKIYPPAIDNQAGQYKVDSIALHGYSRGGVSAFATAKKLDGLGIDMHIVANQPVPGGADSIIEGVGIYKKYNDLSNCKNIKSATTLLSTYNLENGLLQNTFFHQMIAKFPKDIEAKNLLYSCPVHSSRGYDKILLKQVAVSLSDAGFIDKAFAKFYRKEIKNSYESDFFPYTPPELAQKIFGANNSIQKDPIYVEMIREQAGKIVSRNVLGASSASIEAMSFAKAEAIVAISEVMPITGRQALVRAIMADDKKAEQLVEIINKVTGSCKYLERISSIADDGLYEKNKQAVNTFQKDMILASHEFINKTSPTALEKKEFENKLIKLTETFHKDAPEISAQNIFSQVANFIVRSVAKIVGVELLDNRLAEAVANRSTVSMNNTIQVIKTAFKGPSLDEIKAEMKSSQIPTQEIKEIPVSLAKPSASVSVQKPMSEIESALKQDLKQESKSEVTSGKPAYIGQKAKISKLDDSPEPEITPTMKK